MINSFTRNYYFLSNFYEVPVTYQGLTYQNNEAAFQAQKTEIYDDRKQFCNLNPSEAKKLGRHIKLRPDWESIKERIMFEICYAKFTQNPDLKAKLLDTCNHVLIEGNTWGDKIWGMVDGEGENKLGRILMDVRALLNFSAKSETIKIVHWIREFFNKNGKDCKAVVGISGGKDSSVVAALCVKALGKDRVLGVFMPDGNQKDINDSYKVVDHLGIEFANFNIGPLTRVFREDWIWESDEGFPMAKRIVPTRQAEINLPPRLRMAALYFISQSVGGRVANTCNLSEDYVGYSTRYGDSVGDFSPLSRFTTDEVIAIGRECGLPESLLVKAPADGLTGRTDEDILGFSYATLNRFIRLGYCSDEVVKKKIVDLHNKNKFKLELMPCYEY